MFQLAQRRNYYFAFSGVLVGLGILAMIISTAVSGFPFRVSVDFTGGTRLEVQFTEPVTEDQLRAVYNDEFGITNPEVIALSGEGLQNAWQIRTEPLAPEQTQAIEIVLNEQVAPLIPETTQFEQVTPAVGREVSQAAFVAILVTSFIILGYIGAAFRTVPNPIRYGLCAVSAMFHDLLIIFGFMAIMGMLLGWEIDALFVTAVLTIAGFSLQDTIVVFDRIRENLTKRPTEDYETIVNRSVLETIHRSLATQLAAMFIMVALIFFGGASVQQFISVLFVGLLSGTYSSIFHAVPLLAAWEIRAEQATV